MECLVEEDFINNSEKVFGVHIPSFGKLIYLYLSKGYDKSKISFARFIEGFMPFLDDENKNYVH